VASRRTLVRGGITLAVLAAMAAAMVVSPAGAHITTFGHLKKHVKKIAKQEATKVFDSKIGPATAPLQEEADLLYATVNNAGVGGVTLVHGRGVTQVLSFAATIVEFNRSVTDCTANATYGGNPTNDAFASVEYGSEPDRINVWLTDASGNLVFGTGEMFHLIVVCP
jgi:hypothetical protein